MKVVIDDEEVSDEDLLEVIKWLKGLAKWPQNCEHEGFCASSWSGGSADRAYELGESDGEAQLARWILWKLDIKYEVIEDA